MSDARTPAPTIGWPALVLAGALGAWLSALARAAGHALADVPAQQTAAVLAFAIALGQVMFALRRGPADGTVTDAATAAATAALGLPIATVAWLALLPVARTGAGTACSAVLLALPLAAASYSAAAELSSRRPGAPMAAWLAAAAAGAIGALLALPALGAHGVLAGASLLAAGAALGYGRTRVQRGAGLVALLVAAAASVFASHLLAVPDQSAPPAELRRLRAGAAALGATLRLRSDRWDMGGRVQSFELVDRNGAATGIGALLRDSALGAPLVRPPATAELKAALCGQTLLAVPYDAARGQVLIAGLGGGLELLCAVQHRAARVDVAEPSGAQREAVRAFVGAGLDGGAATRVRYVSAQARAAARARGPDYDLVVVANARTKHTLPPGVLPLPEPLAETDRGLRELLSALRKDGALWMVVRGEPAALRLAATVFKALHALGAAAPAGHLAVLRDGDNYGVLAGRSALGMNRIIELHGRAKRRNAPVNQPALAKLFDWPLASPELIWTPGAAFANRFGLLFSKPAGPRASLLADRYVFDLAAATDDRPLFHERTRRDRPDTWPSGSALHALPLHAGLALGLALGLCALLALRLRPAAALRSALALGGLGAGQTLFFAFWLHAIALWIDRPEQSFALTALALPAFALMRLPWRLAERALPWALAVHALAAAAAVPLAPLLVLLLGHSAVAIATVLLFALAAAAAWYPLRG